MVSFTLKRLGSLRLEMERDHPVLVQHSKCHTQGWRANGDISLILSKSDPSNPSVDEILATKNTLQGMPAKVINALGLSLICSPTL